MQQWGITGEAMTQTQMGCPSKEMNGSGIFSSHFCHGGFINSNFQELNSEKNKHESINVHFRPKLPEVKAGAVSAGWEPSGPHTARTRLDFLCKSLGVCSCDWHDRIVPKTTFWFLFEIWGNYFNQVASTQLCCYINVIYAMGLQAALKRWCKGNQTGLCYKEVCKENEAGHAMNIGEEVYIHACTNFIYSTTAEVTMGIGRKS